MDQQNYEDEVNLVDYLKVIFKHRLMIIVLVFCSMVSAGSLSLLQPKVYEATATFFPMNIKEESTATLMKPKIDIENLVISILESRKMADRIIEQLNLNKLWKKELMTDSRNILKKTTKITLEKNGIIKLVVRNESAQLAANIANAYVDNLDYFNRELELGSQKQIVQLIDRAVVPERKIPRGTLKIVLLSAAISFFFAIFLALLIESFKRNEVWKKLKQN
jgi:uncharacterized protein involved in exopolysaccharide biosynthesis